MYRIYHEIYGMNYGNFDYRVTAPRDVLSLLEKIKTSRLFGKIYGPRCQFTNRIVKIGQEDQNLSGWYIRSKNPADGVIVENSRDAAAFFNADCPIVAVYDEVRERCAALHAGFRCLVPKKNKKFRERSILKVLFEDYGFEPKYVNVFFGYGIGPCCYGAEHYEELNDPTIDLPLGRATRGSRAGQKSIDIYKLIYNQLAALGVPGGKIRADLRCTSCDGLDKPKYFSNVRVLPEGRNAVLIWLDI